MPLELVANSPTPGVAAPIATLNIAVTTAPIAGTVETWTFNQSPPAGLCVTGGQYHFVIDGEICIDTTGAAGITRTITRGAEGSTVVSHVLGALVFHHLTAEAISNLVGLALVDRQSVLTYGALCDGQTVADGAITNGQAVLTSASAPYTLLDVGKTVYVIGAGAAAAVLKTTIQAFTNASTVTLAATAGTTVTGASVIWATNSLSAFQQAANANPNGTIKVPAHAGQFYLIDGGGPAGSAPNGIAPAGTYLTVLGDGRDSTIIRLGPEGATASGGFNMFTHSAAQTIVFRNLTLQGPDQLGNGGPAVNPGTPGSSTWCQPTIRTSTNTIGGGVRFIDCHVRRFSFIAVNGAGALEGFYSMFEGYGTAWRSMGPSGGDDGTTGYDPRKVARFDHCRFTAFGDPGGGQFYHSLYYTTSHDLYVDSCTFDTPAASSTGAVCQQFDGSVTLANAGRHGSYVNCYFGSTTQTAVLTSYNCPTRLLGCTFDAVQNSAVFVAGPTIIDDCTFTSGTAVNVVTTTAQGQTGTGLDWSLLVSNSRFRWTANVSATMVNVAHANSGTSEYTVDTCVFEGGSNSGFGVNVAVAGARVNVTNCTFKDHPNIGIRAVAASTLSVKKNRFWQTGGTNILNATTALTALNVVDNEFSGGTPFSLSVTPTLMWSANNHGSQWVARTAVAASYTMLPYDDFIAITSTSAPRAVTAVAASSVHGGKEVVLADESGGAATNNITFTPAGADTLKGSGVINTNNGFQRWRSNGSNSWTRVG